MLATKKTTQASLMGYHRICLCTPKRLALYNDPMDKISTERLKNIARQFTLAAEVTNVNPFGRGHINDTFLITTKRGGHYVLQRLNPIFAPSVLEDIDAITRTMEERGILTTRLVRTKCGGLSVVEHDGHWRMLSFIPGRTVEEGITKDEAKSAMELIGNFHQTFAEHDYAFRHVREGFHDTPSIMAGLENTLSTYRGTEKDATLREVGSAILEAYRSRGHAWEHLPRRIIHGDTKLNNVRFASGSPRAIALVDLDTLGRHSVVVDLADAARSWCNRADEGDSENAKFDLDIFRAMIEGYAKTANFLTEEERGAVPNAIAQIALELSARFLADAYHESYFKLDREHYPDLFTQNSTKARAQLALYRDIRAKISEITDYSIKKY